MDHRVDLAVEPAEFKNMFHVRLTVMAGIAGLILHAVAGLAADEIIMNPVRFVAVGDIFVAVVAVGFDQTRRHHALLLDLTAAVEFLVAVVAGVAIHAQSGVKVLLLGKEARSGQMMTGDTHLKIIRLTIESVVGL